MARVLGTATLIPNAQNEQTVSIGISATWATFTVVMNTANGWAKSDAKAGSTYQHCQSIATDRAFNEPGYVVRIRDKIGYSIVATARLKSFNAGSITLKDITAPTGACQMLIEAGN